jgi:hypothetical protein
MNHANTAIKQKHTWQVLFHALKKLIQTIGVIWLASLFAGANAGAQQKLPRLEFKGFVLGGSISDFKTLFPGFCETKVDGRESCFYSRSLCTELRDKSPRCQNTPHPITEFGGTNANRVVAVVEDGKVGSLSLTIGISSFDPVVSALSSKFGEATRKGEYKWYAKNSATPEMLQELIWEVGGGEIRVRTRDWQDPLSMLVLYVSPAAIQQEAAAKKATNDAAKKQL